MNLDNFQKDIVECKKRNILTIASPGSGKTTVIVNRAGHIIKNCGVKPAEIIIITFTRAAAENMKNRFIKLFGKENVPFFGTFHSFFYNLLKKHYGKIELINQKIAVSVIGNILKQQVGDSNEEKINEILNCISSLKCSKGKSISTGDNIDKRVVINCYNEYERYLKNNKLLDFDDLQLRTLQLLTNNNELLNMYRNSFKYYMVDEFQDCDEIQIELLKLLTLKGSLFAVGDEDQCIYGFRGSRPDYMVNFEKHFLSGIKKYLCNNYRSGIKIVQVASNLIQNNIIRNDKKFLPVNKWNGNVNYIFPTNDREQGEFIANKLRLLKDNGELYKDNVILYRTNIESRSIIDALVRYKIPFSLSEKRYNFFNHFICKDIISYLKLSRDMTDRESFGRIINRPFRYISKVSIEKIMKYPFKENCFEIANSIHDLPFFQFKELNKAYRAILGLDKIKPSLIVEYVMDRVDYKGFLKEYCKRNYINQQEVIEIVDELKNCLEGFNSIDDFFKHIERVNKAINRNKVEGDECVELSTIHGVKGMEFKNVFIINCVKGYIPYERLNRTTNIEEERRIFYVAITRAIDNIFMICPRLIKGKAKELSSFIEECQYNV